MSAYFDDIAILSATEEEEEEITHESESSDDDKDDFDNDKDERAKNGEEGGTERHNAHYELRPQPRGTMPFF